jgi:hypothetical protein
VYCAALCVVFETSPGSVVLALVRRRLAVGSLGPATGDAAARRVGRALGREPMGFRLVDMTGMRGGDDARGSSTEVGEAKLK